MANGENARSWVQWAVGIMMPLVIGVATIGWNAYNECDERLDVLEADRQLDRQKLDRVDKNVEKLLIYAEDKEKRTKEFYEKRPLFWSDMETILNHEH